jgi:hypothetical protein
MDNSSLYVRIDASECPLVEILAYLFDNGITDSKQHEIIKVLQERKEHGRGITSGKGNGS